jgi:hypothetical protein
MLTKVSQKHLTLDVLLAIELGVKKQNVPAAFLRDRVPREKSETPDPETRLPHLIDSAKECTLGQATSTTESERLPNLALQEGPASCRRREEAHRNEPPVMEAMSDPLRSGCPLRDPLLRLGLSQRPGFGPSLRRVPY